jgi:putative hydrolase of the HAD superfamily
MNLGVISAVTFDAAGTLFFPYPSVGEIYANVLKRHCITAEPHVLESSFKTAFQTVSKDETVLDPEEREKDFWRQVVAETLLPTRVKKDQFEPIFSDMWETFSHGDHWKVYPEVIETLTTLINRGYQTGILSNWDSRLYTVLKETGLNDLFSIIVISSEVGVEKPDSGIFAFAEEKLGHHSSACLHVGDSHHHDIMGAQAAGWQSIHIRHGNTSPSNGEISHLGELLNILLIKN